MNRQKRQQQILQKALQYFYQTGYANVTVSDLVREAGVSRGTFYLYFKSKKEIFETLIDSFLEPVLKHLSRMDLSFRVANFHDGHESAVIQELSYCLAQNQLLTKILIMHGEGLEKEHRQKVHLYLQQIYQILEEKLKSATEAGASGVVDLSLLSCVLVGGIKEILLGWDDSNDVYDLQFKIRDLFTLVTSGLVRRNNVTEIKPASSSDYLDDMPQAKAVGLA